MAGLLTLLWKLALVHILFVHGNSGTTIKITTILNEPFTMRGDTSSDQQTDLVGFIPDLLEEMCRIISAQCDVNLTPTGRYGSMDENGTWTGMLGEVERGEVDLAAAPLLITANRERHFTIIHPFMDLKLTALVKKSSHLVLPDFNLFTPFSFTIWLLIGIAYIVVVLLTWAMNLFNPNEWGAHSRANHHIWSQEAESYSLSGSLWFYLSTFTRQAYKTVPRSLSVKVLGLGWFLFSCLLMVVYVGNAADWLLLSAEAYRYSSGVRFSSLDQLMMDNRMEIGTVKGGSTHRYFRDVSISDKIHSVNERWERDPSLLVTSTSEGLERVRQGNYAFITDTAVASYEVHRSPCDLETVGEPFSMIGYGFMVSKDTNTLGYEIAAQLHLAVLEMRERGILARLERKWWYNKGDCPIQRSTARAPVGGLEVSVDASMVWQGVLLYLCGAVLSFCISVAEYCFSGKQDTTTSGQRADILKEEMT